MTNFMLQDIGGLLLATLIFPLFVVIPGYVLGWWGDVLEFRNRRLETRILIGMVLSISIFPVLYYLTAKILPFGFIIFLHIPLWIFFVVHLYTDLRFLRMSLNKWERLALGLTILWGVVAVFSLIDIQIGHGVYYSVMAYDHAARIALTDSIIRGGIPVSNPTFFPGQPFWISYFYFWSIVCALPSKLSGHLLDARITFFAGILWVGVALRAVTALYIRLFYPGRAEETSKRIAMAIGLFFVTGFDILFSGILMVRSPGFAFVTEWWNGNAQVTAWIGATLWVPHHVASLVACLTSMMIFKAITPDMNRKKKAFSIALAGAGFASSFGMSVYVTLIFVVAWAIWLIVSLFFKEMRYRLPWMIGTGLVAFAMAGPFLLEVLSLQGRAQSGPLIAFGIRSFEPVRTIILNYGLGDLAENLIYLLVLPINYSFEFGFFLFAGLIYMSYTLRRRGLADIHFVSDIILLASSLLVCTFFHSATIASNDLGWRGLMPAQFVLLIWSVDLAFLLFPAHSGKTSSIQLSSSRTRGFLLAALLIGLISTGADLLYLRFYYVINDLTTWFPVPAEGRPDRRVGERTAALREAYAFIGSAYPDNVKVESNPDVEILNREQGLYSHRQIVADGPGTGVEVYGLSREEYETLAHNIFPLFESYWLDESQAMDLCRRLNINLLIMKDTDPVWRESGSWIWQTHPVFSNDFVRVIACR